MEDDNTKKQSIATDDDSDEISDDSKMKAEDREYQETIKEIERMRKEREEKKKAAMEKLKKEREGCTKSTDEDKTGGQGMIAGEKKKIYSHEIKVFRHNKLNDFSVSGLKKIDKTLQKVHGVDVKKKIAFVKALEAYNPTKSTLRKKDFDKFARGFKSKRFNGKYFQNVEKAGIDIKSMRKKFSKRDIDKLRRGITGDQDPYKYKSKSSDDIKKGNSSAPAKSTRVH